MQISREQYDRFLNNQCSEEERLLFSQYLVQHPELLDNWLKFDNWEKFQQDMNLHPAYSGRMRNHFVEYMQSRKRKVSSLRSLSVAAIVSGLLLIPAAWFLFDRPADKTAIVKETKAVWSVISNTSDSISTILLEDQSVVKLYANSELKFRETPEPNKRDVYLQGTARFAVAKDAARPFTVYTGTIATTALGTSFTVDSDTSGKKVLVKLHEGKVVVRKMDSTSYKKYYLLPGDQLTMNPSGTIRLQKIAPKLGTTSIKKTNSSSSDALSYNNLPLTEVLKQLSKKFNTEINYDEQELKAIYITASFTGRDTLPGILEIICVLNNLRLQRSGSGYAIGR